MAAEKMDGGRKERGIKEGRPLHSPLKATRKEKKKKKGERE